MKYCSHCGKPLDDAVVFCVYCGGAQATDSHPTPATKKKPKKKLLRRWWFWVLVVVIFIAVITMPINSGGAKDVQTKNAVDTSASAKKLDVNPETTPAPSAAEIKEAFISSCIEIENIKDIVRNPDEYLGNNYEFICYISSVRESKDTFGAQKYYISYLFDMEEAERCIKSGYAKDFEDAKWAGADYDACIWLMEARTGDAVSPKILEEDVVRVYGTFNGLTKTQNAFTKETGEEMAIDIKYVELIND